MTCRNCGYELSDGMNYCPNCGIPVKTYDEVKREREEAEHSQQNNKKNGSGGPRFPKGILIAVAVVIIAVVAFNIILPMFAGNKKTEDVIEETIAETEPVTESLAPPGELAGMPSEKEDIDMSDYVDVIFNEDEMSVTFGFNQDRFNADYADKLEYSAAGKGMAGGVSNDEAFNFMATAMINDFSIDTFDEFMPVIIFINEQGRDGIQDVFKSQKREATDETLDEWMDMTSPAQTSYALFAIIGTRTDLEAGEIVNFEWPFTDSEIENINEYYNYNFVCDDIMYQIPEDEAEETEAEDNIAEEE